MSNLPTYKSNICEIIEGTLGDNRTSKSLLTKMTMGMVSNDSFLCGGFQVAIRADATDGLPDIIIIQNSELLDTAEINKHKKR
jgi:hypothetical protein